MPNFSNVIDTGNKVMMRVNELKKIDMDKTRKAFFHLKKNIPSVYQNCTWDEELDEKIRKNIHESNNQITDISSNINKLRAYSKKRLNLAHNLRLSNDLLVQKSLLEKSMSLHQYLQDRLCCRLV